MSENKENNAGNVTPEPLNTEEKGTAGVTSGPSDKAKLIGILAGVGTVLLGAVIGLLWFLRPSESQVEKRYLTEFPAMTSESVSDGTWCSQVSLWYADTYPTREGMISLWHGIQNLFGIRNVQANVGDGEDIPDQTMNLDVDDNPPSPDDTGSDGAETSYQPGDGKAQDGDTVGGLYVVGDTAYELYYFNENMAKRYATLVNSAARQLEGQATVYDVIVPLSYSFYLNTSTQNKLKASNGQKAISYIYSGMNDRVKTVDAFTELSRHTDEYIYFRTDHHWTATGAFYAFKAFAGRAGLSAPALSDYQTMRFDGFLGTLYADADQPRAMKNNPDYVIAYMPSGTNCIRVLDKNASWQTYSTGIVQVKTDTIYQAAASKYNCFIVGDNPLSVIHNENIASGRRGTSILLIKESFGNAFAPFLVDAYEYVYIIDYRYYSGEPGESGTLTHKNLKSFVTAHGIDTVLFLNTIMTVTTDARLTAMERFVAQ